MSKEKKSYEQVVKELPPRFTYLHHLWLSLDGLTWIISQHIDPQWDFYDEDKTEIFGYKKDIDETLSLIKKGKQSFNCPIAKNVELYILSLDRIYRDCIQHAELCEVEEQKDVFCSGFYGAFLSRAKSLYEQLMLFVTKAQIEADSALKSKSEKEKYIHTQETANIAITALLPKLKKDKMPLKKIGVRFLAKEIGCSTGLISGCPAWIAFRQKRDGKQKTSSKTTRLNDVCLNDTPADTQTPEKIAMEKELKALCAEQEADMNNQNGPNRAFPDR